eukprot:comp17140_c0_seq1/m.15944 comp17140_c0_seq1/g.15944  ORF comp17140_c0_seq1/g.15944 comp17140_c0_seq1/m.15944 type:complete len:345 (+) comp17140_c0_seq1:800-1834(+)
MHGLAHLFCVLVEGWGHGHNLHLARRQPEGPFAGIALRQHSHKALHGAEHSTVHNHRPLDLPIRRAVLELEVDGQLEVQLDGGTLVLAAQRILDRDVDLWAVESTITGVELVALAQCIQALLQLRLSPVPQLQFTHVLLGPGRQLERKRETKQPIHVLDKIKRMVDFVLDLIVGTENVCIVLLESPHTGKAVQCPRELVAVKDTKIGHADGQLTPAACAVAEHQAVAGAVHGLEGIAGILIRLPGLDHKHVVLIVLPVAGGLPQPRVEHVWCHHLSEPTLVVLPPDQSHQAVVDPCAVGKEEARTRAELVEEEQLLFFANLPVVPLSCLLLQGLPLLHQFVVGE